MIKGEAKGHSGREGGGAFMSNTHYIRIEI
jgi:hypothetical protein